MIALILMIFLCGGNTLYFRADAFPGAAMTAMASSRFA